MSGLVWLNAHPPSSQAQRLLVDFLQALRATAEQDFIASTLASDSEGDEGADCLLWLPSKDVLLSQTALVPVQVRDTVCEML